MPSQHDLSCVGRPLELAWRRELFVLGFDPCGRTRARRYSRLVNGSVDKFAGQSRSVKRNEVYFNFWRSG